MQIIPAIDIKDGHCVRLKQGDMQSATVFSEDPAAMAQHWLELGAERLHLVDLNGAVAGKPRNELAIREIVSVIGEEIPVQLGGGIRDLDTIERYLDDGERFYFAHSFYPVPADPALTAATASYPTPFTCAIARANIFAVQFHPEKSHTSGLKLLRNFIDWKP